MNPLEQRARHLSTVGGPAAACLRYVLAELDAARAEIRRLEALSAEQDRLRTLGGLPPEPVPGGAQ